MKKKVLAAALAGVFAFSLAACGSSDSSSSSSSAEEAEDESGSDQEITFESLTVVDNDECSIVITGIEEDRSYGYTLDAEFENKSSDKTYMFAVITASVNGVQYDPFFAETVTAGNKAADTLEFNDEDLLEYGVEDITDIEITFHVYDDDDWTADDVAYETVHVYPYGEENATVYERESQDTDQVLVDNDYVTMTVIGYDIDSIWGYEAEVFLVNKTDSDIMFSVEDASVNGYMVDPFWADTVYAGNCEFSSIYWSESDLEEIGISDMESEIESIELQMNIYNDDDFTEYVNESYTLNP